MKRALVIIDMLNDFIHRDGALYINGGEEIIDSIREEKERAKKNGIPIIYICDFHRKNDPEFKIWPPHCVQGTKGAEIIDELKPDKDDIVVKKNTYSGFYKTDLEKILEARKIENLILTGVATNICVLYTAADARMRGYAVEVLKEGVEGLTSQDKKWALTQMKKVLQVLVK
ncbi:MAG: isochorismatase family cysteine hydrolase [candidate division WOR-3 bacterium]|nr:isochorismatase family cysteine hydrolase [candidate division WOR-3 bacterium]